MVPLALPALSFALLVPLTMSAFFFVAINVFFNLPTEIADQMLSRLHGSYAVLVPFSFISALVGSWRAKRASLVVSLPITAAGAALIAVFYSSIGFVLPRSMALVALGVGIALWTVGPALWVRLVAARPNKALERTVHG